MQPDHRTHEDSPHQEGQSAKRQQNQSQNDDGNVMILSNPDVKFAFREIGNITRERGRIVMHGLTHQDPAHMRPPFTVKRSVWIAFLIRMLMMNAVRGDPEDGSDFERKSGTRSKNVL